jgi:hypothetical protein
MRWRLRYWVQDPLGEVCNLLIKKNNILKKKRRKEIEPFVEFLVYLLYTSTIHGPLCFFKEICLLRKKKKKKGRQRNNGSVNCMDLCDFIFILLLACFYDK